MGTGVRETDVHFSRVPLMELDSFMLSTVVSTGWLDLVDFFPARHYRVFNPAAAAVGGPAVELPFPATPGNSDGAFPEPRFVVHYMINANAIVRTSVAASQMNLKFTTSVFDTAPDLNQTTIAYIPWVGQPTLISSLVSGALIPGECQKGQFVVTGRSLMVTAAFNNVNPGGNFWLGVYLAPCPG